jgi:hypothetical protein
MHKIILPEQKSTALDAADMITARSGAKYNAGAVRSGMNFIRLFY